MAIFGSNKARKAALRAAAGEPVLGEGPAIDLGLNSAAIHLVITDTRFIWSYTKRPDIVLDLPFKFVSEVGTRQSAIKLTSRDPNLADPLSGGGETDAIFDCSSTPELALLLRNQVEKRSDAWQRARRAAAHLAELRATPVSDWPSCPNCEADLQHVPTAEHTVRCTGCALFFSDPGYRPQVQDGGAQHGDLLGDEVHQPLFGDVLQYKDWPVPSIMRPPQYDVGPITVPHWDLVERAATQPQSGSGS